MSVALLVSAFILARVEAAGSWPTARRYYEGREKSKPRPSVVTRRQVAAMQAELVGWKIDTRSLITGFGLLVKTGLLVQDETGHLKLSRLAFSWLQLSPAAAHRLLFEAAGLILPPSLDFSDTFQPGSSEQLKVIEYCREVLNFLGLDKVEAQDLLKQLGENRQGEAAELDLAAAWLETYPAATNLTGWIIWQAETESLVFRANRFDTWQLFRLLSFCRVAEGGEPDIYGLLPEQALVVAARRRHISLEALVGLLDTTMNRAAPGELVLRLRGWYQAAFSFKARSVFLLEAENRAAMQALNSNRGLRQYLRKQLAPRYAEIGEVDLPRLRDKLARQGLMLEVEQVFDLKKVEGGLSVVLSRLELQEVLAGLRFYRGQRNEQGYSIEIVDELLRRLEGVLSRREQGEANWQAAELEQGLRLNSPAEAESASVEVEPEAVKQELYEVLERAIEQETEVLIEYATPGKALRQRRIEPLELYEENNQVYLVAYCQWRREPRLFRLDRLRLVK